MKTKIVLWGTNEKEERILLGIELIEDQSLIKVHSFPEEVATEEFYNQMMNLWREGTHIPFPEGHVEIERKLTMTDDILPDTIKTKRSDILARAKTEWHFVVLSSKLYANYVDEIADIKERVEKITDFDSGIWEELKGFWDKVQNQVREKNLFREHGNSLRQQSNELFGQLKNMRKSLNEELEKSSKETLQKFYEKLEIIEDKVEKGLGLQPIFNELKDIQRKFKDADLTNRHKNDLWKRIDKAFKSVKEKRYGKEASSNNALVRIKRRQEGLMSAIDKMEKSIERDRNEMKFQEGRINNSEGQLEVQLRQAKFAMVEERITSKQKKLDEMLQTKEQLEQKMNQEIAKEKEREAAKEVKAKEVEIKNTIAEEIQAKNEELKEQSELLQNASKAIKEEKKAKSSVIENIEKASMKAAAVISTMVEEVKEKAEDIAEDVSDAIKENDGVSSFIEKAKAKMADVIDDIKEETADILENVSDKIHDVVEDLREEE
jgi:chromosome segregation ATPase